MLGPLGLWLKGETDCGCSGYFSGFAWSVTQQHPAILLLQAITYWLLHVQKSLRSARGTCANLLHIHGLIQGTRKTKQLQVWKTKHLQVLKTFSPNFMFQEQAKSELKTILPEMLILICQKYKHLHSHKWRKLRKLCNYFLNTEITVSLQYLVTFSAFLINYGVWCLQLI